MTVLGLTCAQSPGDEDKDMFNKARHRDQQEMGHAIEGWWTSSMKNHEQRIQWWRDAKFGMFVHWGIYSLPGGVWKGQKVGGYAEHLMRVKKITRKEYNILGWKGAKEDRAGYCTVVSTEVFQEKLEKVKMGNTYGQL